ncbi:MAG: hypothetical protein DDT33_00253 [Firmicutes bacterium]|nr:hypothetical protein [Bacillota bacterium]
MSGEISPLLVFSIIFARLVASGATTSPTNAAKRLTRKAAASRGSIAR